MQSRYMERAEGHGTGLEAHDELNALSFASLLRDTSQGTSGVALTLSSSVSRLWSSSPRPHRRSRCSFGPFFFSSFSFFLLRSVSLLAQPNGVIDQPGYHSTMERRKAGRCFLDCRLARIFLSSHSRLVINLTDCRCVKAREPVLCRPGIERAYFVVDGRSTVSRGGRSGPRDERAI